MALKAAFCVAADSQVFLGVCIAEYFREKNIECSFYIFKHKKEHILSDAHIASLKDFPYERTTSSAFLANLGQVTKKADFDFVFLLMSGPDVHSFVEKYTRRVHTLPTSKKPKKRAILVSGIPGLEIAGHLGPYLMRCSSDVHFVNSPRSLELFRNFAQKYDKSLRLKLDNAYVTGLPIWDRHIRNARSAQFFEQNKKIETVLFAGQNAFPDNLFDRTYLIRKLIDYCRLNPKVNLYYKPRNPPGIKSGHPVLWHEENIISDLKKKSSKPFPENFHLTYENIFNLLDMTDLCLSISSTVIAEAILRNIPAAVMKDPRLSKKKYGYWYFEGSNLFMNFRDLRASRIPKVNKLWCSQNIKADGRNCKNLYHVCMAAHQEQDQSQEMLPFRTHELYTTCSYLEKRKKKK